LLQKGPNVSSYMYLKFFFDFSDGPLPGQTSIPPMDMAEVVGDQVEDYGEEDDGYERGVARQYDLDSDASDEESGMVVLDLDHVSHRPTSLYCCFNSLNPKAKKLYTFITNAGVHPY